MLQVALRVEIKRLNMSEAPSYSLAWNQTDVDVRLSPSYPKLEMDVLEFQRSFVVNGSWGIIFHDTMLNWLALFAWLGSDNSLCLSCRHVHQTFRLQSRASAGWGHRGRGSVPSLHTRLPLAHPQVGDGSLPCEGRQPRVRAALCSALPFLQHPQHVVRVCR
jgi:hypothetical protein